MAYPSSPFPTAVWTNKSLRLYHGTIDTEVQSILAGVNVTKGPSNRDFGQGFYTTTLGRQALTWAWQRSVRKRGTNPVVIQFDVDRDDLASLDSLWFVRGSFDADDFWSLVHHCRSGRASHARRIAGRQYDIVIGPVAASWKQRLSISDVDQVSFHTRRGARILDASSPRIIP